MVHRSGNATWQDSPSTATPILAAAMEAWENAIDNSAILGQFPTINAQTGTTFTPALTDQGDLVTLNNAGAVTVSLPQDSAVAFPVGAEVTFVNIGAGTVTFAAGTGATVNGVSLTAAQWVLTRAIKRAANTWVVVPVSAGGADATTSSKGIVQLAGDLAGTAAAPTVAKIATATISGTPGTPSSSNFLRGDGTWATPAGGSTFGMLTTSGDYFLVPGTGSSNNLNPTSGMCYFFPLIMGANTGIQQIGVYVSAAGAAGAVGRMAIYADTGAGRPGAIISGTDTGSFSVAATGAAATTLTGVTLTAGALYWVALCSTWATTTWNSNALVGPSAIPIPLAGLASPPSAAMPPTGYTATGYSPSSAMPSTASLTGLSRGDRTPTIFLKAA